VRLPISPHPLRNGKDSDCAAHLLKSAILFTIYVARQQTRYL
jgi:hypothetical protein